MNCCRERQIEGRRGTIENLKGDGVIMPQSKLMPSILDREITAKADDTLGHQDFANALTSLIESEHHQPPYSIGLLGPWAPL